MSSGVTVNVPVYARVLRAVTHPITAVCNVADKRVTSASAEVKLFRAR